MSRPATPNPFERLARAEKTNELSLTLELATRQMSPAMALWVVSRMTDEQWRTVAAVSRVNVPSDVTRAQVIERFARLAEDRTEGDRLAREYLARTLGVAA
jgi:hypothetical protein